MLAEGFRFNLMVNDNDGSVHESWTQIAYGIAGEKMQERYPLLIFKNK